MDNLNRTYRPTRNARHAMTLVELLVVVLLLGIIMGIAATAVKNGTKGKKLREASRQVNAFVAGAQARAIETGRPVGIEIVRNENEPRAGLQIFLTETPATYAGDTTTATLQVTIKGSLQTVSSIRGNYYTFEDKSLDSISMSFLINNGDYIQLNFRGEWYKISNFSGGKTFQIFVPQVDNSFNYNYGDPGGDFVRYKIKRQPIRSSVSPLQMPTDTCVDLAFSGMGIGGQQFHPWNKTNFSRVVGFTFNSRGGIDRFNYADAPGSLDSVRPTGTVYLLVGRYDGLISIADAEAEAGANYGDFTSWSANKLKQLLTKEENGELEDPSNISNPNSIWVTINHLTGKITTSNNAFIDSTSGTDNDELLAKARRLSKEAYSITGRGGQ
ncbi:MAG: hypothetical protein COA78_18880 [Blastopirellula sp.]|nr:MAG: hypothetical protein COA78_18880 [Blastopirellula sp.]